MAGVSPAKLAFPSLRKGEIKLAANGRNRLAHMTEFHRPDDTWSVPRALDSN